MYETRNLNYDDNYIRSGEVRGEQEMSVSVL